MNTFSIMEMKRNAKTYIVKVSPTGLRQTSLLFIPSLHFSHFNLSLSFLFPLSLLSFYLSTPRPSFSSTSYGSPTSLFLWLISPYSLHCNPFFSFYLSFTIFHHDPFSSGFPFSLFQMRFLPCFYYSFYPSAPLPSSILQPFYCSLLHLPSSMILLLNSILTVINSTSTF
jgi:hypothetical protein